MTSSAKWHVSAVLHTSSSLRHRCIIGLLPCSEKSPKPCSKCSALPRNRRCCPPRVAVHHPFLGCCPTLPPPLASPAAVIHGSVVMPSCRFRQATLTRLRMSARVAGALCTSCSTLLPQLEPCKVLQAFRNFYGGPGTGLATPAGPLFPFHLFHGEEPQSGEGSIQLCAVPLQSDRTHFQNIEWRQVISDRSPHWAFPYFTDVIFFCHSQQCPQSRLLSAQAPDSA